jgi:hypothetical protein
MIATRHSIAAFLGKMILFGFCAFCFYLLWLVSVSFLPGAFRPNLPLNDFPVGFSHQRFRDAAVSEPVDIVVLGPSRAYRGYDPRKFSASGYTLFNLGSTAQTPIQSEILAKRYIEHLQPKVVIVDVYAGMFSSDGVESSLDILANDRVDGQSMQLMVRQRDMLVTNALLYYGMRGLLGIEEHPVNPIKTDTYVQGGYVSTSVEGFSANDDILEISAVNQHQLDAFGRMIRWLESQNIKVVLVHSPIPTITYDKPTFDSLMRTFGTYYDFSEMREFTTAHFYDQLHLNQKGVELYNAYLIEYLKAQGVMNMQLY